MLQSSEINATFFTSTFENSREIGMGFLDIAGIDVSYKVYPSQYDFGFMVAFPSKPRIKDGVHQLNPKTGKPDYFNEVYIKDQSIKPLIYEAVQKAMHNKGVDVANISSSASQGYSKPSTSFAPVTPPPMQVDNSVRRSAMEDDLPF